MLVLKGKAGILIIGVTHRLGTSLTVTLLIELSHGSTRPILSNGVTVRTISMRLHGTTDIECQLMVFH